MSVKFRPVSLATLLVLIASAFFISTYSQTTPDALELLCRVDSVATKVPNDSIVIPIYLNNVLDSVSGFQLFIASADQYLVRFAPDSSHGAVIWAKFDTVGTRSSGWSIASRILDDLGTFVLISGIAPPGPNSPNGIPPADGVLIKLIAQTSGKPLGYSVVPIMLNHTQTQFANMRFRTIGCNYDSLGHCTIDTTKLVLQDGKVFTYLCGDANADSSVDISDPVYMLQCIFMGCEWPETNRTMDANCDQQVDISDIVYLIQYIFSGGPAPCASCP